MAKKKKKAVEFDPFTRGKGATAQQRERDKQRKLAKVHDPKSKRSWNRRNKSANNVGIAGMQELKGDLGRGAVPHGMKRYGWIEDHGHPDHVVVKNRLVADHPQGRKEGDYCAAGLEEGRADGGVRIENKRQYNENYDDIFGDRKRGVAAGHKKFTKKYK